MNEIYEQFDKIIADSRENVKKLSKKLIDETEEKETKDKILTVADEYDKYLSNMESKKRDDSKAKDKKSKGIKIVLDNDPTSKSEEEIYGQSLGAFVSDKDPIILKTKNGKRIVLDEDPIAYISPYGHKVDLESKLTGNSVEMKELSSPLTGHKIYAKEGRHTLTGNKFEADEDHSTSSNRLTGNIIEIDEDPSSVILRSGKKILLDEDPVRKRLLTNNILIMDENHPNRLTGHRIELSEGPSRLTGHKIELESERTSKITGNVIELDEEPIEISIVEE